jgi:LacI family gluconate utilization system Gnt-I transcriptional repressor
MSRRTAASQANAGAPAGPSRGTPVRLVDVARLAGVSTMTVSRAMRHPEQVADSTLRAVQGAVAQLGYLPDSAASALATGRSRIVAAIVPTLMNSVYASTVHGLASILRGAGYELMLGDSSYDPSTEAALVRSFLGRRVDALVLTGVEHDSQTRALLARHEVPVVEIWDLTTQPIDMLVGFSNVGAGLEAGRYFAAQGRRRWAFLGTSPQREGRSGKRLRGLREAARAAGLAAPVPAFVDDGMSPAAGRDAVLRLLDSHPQIDALFCANDALATAALRAAADRAVPVPTALSVLGFGDFDIAAHTSPALTTVRIPGREIGERAACALLARLEGTDPALRRVDVGFEIVGRESA